MIHRDEVHGDIRYDDVAVALLNTPQLQRLGRVYQLGFGHLVYRGGNHTRLSHAMGTYLTAASLARALQRNYEAVEAGAPPVQGAILPPEFLPRSPQHEAQQVLSPELTAGTLKDRWTVFQHLVCWAALLHDVGHVPLGHTLEDEFDQIYERHDSFTSPRLRYLWFDPDSEISGVLTDESRYPPAFANMGVSGSEVKQAVLLICTWKERIDEDGKRTTFRELLQEKGGGIVSELIAALDAVEGTLFRPFMADLVANTISADYLDYLRRDPHNLGLDVLRDGRIVSRFWVGRDHREQPRMALALLDRHGQERLDTCTGVVEMVRQRYRFAEIVYYHKTKVAASAMLAKVFHLIEKPPELPAPRSVLSIANAKSQVDELLAAEGSARTRALRTLIDEATPRSLLDPEVGDEGLDAILRAQAFKQLREALKLGEREAAENAVRGIALLDALARRQLYKTVFTMNAGAYFKLKEYRDQQRPEHELIEMIRSLRSDPNRREQIERSMASAAGWAECSVILYVPGRKSQAKGIETGALSRGPVATLSRHPAVKTEVENLNQKYKELWRCIMLVHPDQVSDAIGLSAALDAFVHEICPDTDLSSEGVIQAVRDGAWFSYIETRNRGAAAEFSELTGGEVGLTGWEVFKKFGNAKQPCSAREHSLGASLALALVTDHESSEAVEKVAKLGSAGEIVEIIESQASEASASLLGALDDPDAVRTLQIAIERVADRLRSGEG